MPVRGSGGFADSATGALLRQLQAHGVPVTQTRTATFRQLVLHPPPPSSPALWATPLPPPPGKATALMNTPGPAGKGSPASRRQRLAVGRVNVVKVRLSDAEKDQLAALAAARVSTPRLLIEAALAGTTALNPADRAS